MIYALLIIIIFMLFVWDVLLFAHNRRVVNKLDEILKKIKD